MENRAHALATGIFILFLGGVLALVAAWFQGDQGEKIDFTIVSRSGVSGLNVKAPVKLRGVLIGKVESIGFDSADAARILIGIRVAKTAPLTEATVARLGYQGITGLSYIDLSDPVEGKAAAPLLKAGAAPIELQASMLDRLSSSGPQLLERFSEVAVRLNTLLGEGNQQAFSRSLSNFNEAATQVAALGKALGPTAAALPPLTAQTRQLMAGAGASLQRIDSLTTESTLLAQELRQRAELLDRIGLASTQVQMTAQRLDAALVGGKGLRSQPLVDVWSQSGRAVERVANQIGEQPQSVLFGPQPAPAGPGEAGFDAETRKVSK
ncbi:MlaD family protein [Roseateles oligotrophus]|uniref:MlaD family protein n=1 Tax=Roseateles oligotrophus TaxID=1769250 RepID=A0ABT2YAZ4_9BURK|nr:MlaD family protein [Roseateles oligotrophus]MCV2367464.1 MlaD family protein [Roseateles oligotrophus]